MVTRIGMQHVYHNFSVGTAAHPDDEGSMYIVFTDKDNEEAHMFEMKLAAVEEYVAFIQRAKATHSIRLAGANEMPHGAG